MEGIILNVVLTGVLLVFLCVVVMKCVRIDDVPEKLAITVVLLFWLNVSISIFGTIALIWVN
ncbi:MAG: hypothetical protein GY787_32500 [Alteromonadales bacterium]|nr:hypothetical protein [Alteromonadales bacterium]